MIKRKLLVPVIALMISATGYAQSSLIELDNINADTCRQELLKIKGSAGWDTPVVVTYYPDCYYWQKLEPVIEKIAKKYPNRRFYKYNINHPSGKPAPFSSYSTCLQKVAEPGSPSFHVYGVAEDIENGQPVRINAGLLRVQEGGFAEVETPAGLAINEKKIEEFITLPEALVNKKTLVKK